MTVEKNDICQEEGSFTFNWVAGNATIEKGDVVEMQADGTAMKGVGTKPFVGVADHAVAANASFAAYGPGGNKVWAKKGQAGVNVGDYVKDDNDGGFCTSADATTAVGVCIELDGTACKVLLY